jgi:heptosyltransferase-2
MPTLVIQTAFLGDVVLTTPLLSALAAEHGPVDVITTPAAAPLLETHPAVRKVIPYDKRGSDRGWAGVRRLARRLKAEQYTCAYLPHRSLRSAALALLARIPSRIGFSGGWSFLYTEARPKPAQGHEIDRLLALADEPPGAYPPKLVPTAADERAVRDLLAAAGIEDGERLIALAPGSIWGSKRWPYYADLAGQIAEAAAIVAVGGPEDAGLGDEIVGAVRRSDGRAVSACGQLTLRQSAALIGRADVLVTNDSAPLHLATAMGTPVVAVFGPTLPEFGFGPLGAGDVALGVDGGTLPCRPCSNHGPPSCPLGHHRCMRDLGVEAVAAAIEDIGALRRGN